MRTCELRRSLTPLLLASDPLPVFFVREPESINVFFVVPCSRPFILTSSLIVWYDEEGPSGISSGRLVLISAQRTHEQ